MFFFLPVSDGFSNFNSTQDDKDKFARNLQNFNHSFPFFYWLVNIRKLFIYKALKEQGKAGKRAKKKSQPRVSWRGELYINVVQTG